jgi:glyoxylase-like metal-dependent hydrolase (beta-lactamase superfamily II)
MTPTLLTYVLGPLENNTYVLADPASREAAVIDPSFEPEALLGDLKRLGLNLTTVLLTHAHFDHITGIAEIVRSCGSGIRIGLHPSDLFLYREGGSAADFGLPFEIGPEPQILLAAGQVLKIGEVELEVRHTPGHTPGHVVFYCPSAATVFCGDLIFAGSVGRTDLPGGNYAQLIASIRRDILTLPSQTQLLSGHGSPTTVAEEAATNPFLF